MEDSKKIYIWKTLIYFIIYSVLGFFIETIYAIFTKGMLESRKSFLYGPFCAIYGLAAICMILGLKSYRKSPFKVYVFGSIIGLAVEYLCSYLGEKLFYARWWDYSTYFLNIDGRICLFYAVIWGFLACFLLYGIQPKIEKSLEFLSSETITVKVIKIFVFLIIIFIILNAVITSYAVKNFINNVSMMYGIEIRNFETETYKENFFTRYFSNEKMIMVYPNISVVTKDNEVLYLGSILNQYKNYYYRFQNIK